MASIEHKNNKLLFQIKYCLMLGNNETQQQQNRLSVLPKYCDFMKYITDMSFKIVLVSHNLYSTITSFYILLLEIIMLYFVFERK